MSVVTLPTTPAPAEAVPSLLDFGSILRPASGGKATRIDRAGSRFVWEFSFPPMPPDLARTFTGRLLAAKELGLRIPVPLMGVTQGTPGTPLVNGAGQSGKSLIVDGLTPGYVAAEGYWLNVVDSAGVLYLHQLTASVTANGSGQATLSLFPALRAPLADNSAVTLAAPQIEGLVTSTVSWPLTTSRLVRIGFTLEEAA